MWALCIVPMLIIHSQRGKLGVGGASTGFKTIIPLDLVWLRTNIT